MSSSYRKGLYSPWVINMSVLIGLCGVDWIYYETISSLTERLEMSNPYRNPDKTLASLIYEEARSN